MTSLTSSLLRFPLAIALALLLSLVVADSPPASAADGEDASSSGDLDITDDLTITGAGEAVTVVDGGGLDRVFHVIAGAVEISGVTIQNGDASGSVGGGIFNEGALTLTSSTVIGNAAGRDAPNDALGIGVGGGIFNSDGSTLTVSDSTVSGNTATGSGGGGGGIDNEGTLTVNNSAVSDNTSTNGNGGGIRNEGALTLTNSTVAGNMAETSDGGGILNLGDAALTNVTISGNTGAVGGAIASLRGTLTVTNATVSNNTSIVSLGDVFNHEDLSSITLKNTIVANSVGLLQANCRDITSAGHNMDSDGTCSLVGPGDLSKVDAKLGPLADNGGPTQTYALLAGSPAIDAGDDAHLPRQRPTGLPSASGDCL